MYNDVQSVQKNESTEKKSMTTRGVLNIYGIFAFVGLTLTIFTHPITEGVNQFLLFLGVTAAIYFSLLNLYHLGSKWRKVVFVIMGLLAILSLSLAIFSYNLN